MDKTLLGLAVWLLYLGGLFGFAVGVIKFFTGGTPAEYGVMGIGGGFWLLSAVIAIAIKAKHSDA